MGIEIDLLVNYPRTKRNVDERGQSKTEDDRRIARQFGRDFFDGDRRHGYGGFNYTAAFLAAGRCRPSGSTSACVPRRARCSTSAAARAS